MTYAVRARKERGAKIVVIDIYDNATMKQADMGLVLKPGTDGALACAVMHVLFRDGLADREYLARFADDPVGLEAHLQNRTPEWAAAITGLSVEEIEAFARLVGTTRRTFFRLGIWALRDSVTAAANMHAALSISMVTGAWQYEGGGAFHSNSGVLKLNTETVQGTRLVDPSIRHLDQSRIGPVLVGDESALGHLVQLAGDGDADPEHKPGKCCAGAATGEAGFSARRSFHLRARAIHDGYGEAGRCRAARNNVSGARRYLQGRRQPAHHARAKADRSAGWPARKSLCDRGIGQTAGCGAHAWIWHDGARAH